MLLLYIKIYYFIILALNNYKLIKVISYKYIIYSNILKFLSFIFKYYYYIINLNLSFINYKVIKKYYIINIITYPLYLKLY